MLYCVWCIQNTCIKVYSKFLFFHCARFTVTFMVAKLCRSCPHSIQLNGVFDWYWHFPLLTFLESFRAPIPSFLPINSVGLPELHAVFHVSRRRVSRYTVCKSVHKGSTVILSAGKTVNFVSCNAFLFGMVPMCSVLTHVQGRNETRYEFRE